MVVRTALRARYLTVGLALIACGFVVACAGSNPTPAASSPAGSSSTPAASPSSQVSGASVTATETDFKITLSRTSFAAGTVTFVVKNGGQVSHALEVKGQGVDGKTGTLQPGQSANVTVALKTGSYDVFCPVDGHKGLGMNLEIHVA